jgi:hypothetical protein
VTTIDIYGVNSALRFLTGDNHRYLWCQLDRVFICVNDHSEQTICTNLLVAFRNRKKLNKQSGTNVMILENIFLKKIERKKLIISIPMNRRKNQINCSLEKRQNYCSKLKKIAKKLI